MKKINFLAFASLVLTLAFSNVALGQYDDLYYDPDRDAGTYYTTIGADRTQPADNAVASRYDDEENYDDNTASYGSGYDNDDYDYYEDYDYYYTSRVRRFHRPYYGFSYFDPIYADLYYYDPFINPGMTVLIYDGYSSWNNWNSWRRWNRWNSWGSFNRGWGWGNSWNRWNDPWYGGGWNNWGGNNYFINNYYGGGGGWNNWGGGGWNNWGGNGYYCPPSWGNGYNYTTVNTVNNTHYGPRTTGSTRVPRKNDRSPGIDKPETGSLVPKEERQTYQPGSGLTTQPGNARDTRRPATEDGKKPASLDGVGSPETPSRTTRPEVRDRTPVNERPQFEEPRTPRRETTTPNRDDSAPSRPSIDNTRTPRREEASPSRSRQEEARPSTPTRRDDTPAREYRERSSAPERNSSPSRSYDSGNSRQSAPSRSYDNSSRQSAPSRSNDSGGSRQSAPSRSNDNNGKSRSGGRNGG
jgi:hypothetical protein